MDQRISVVTLAVTDVAGTVLRDAHEVYWGGTVGFFAEDGRFRWRGYDA